MRVDVIVERTRPLARRTALAVAALLLAAGPAVAQHARDDGHGHEANVPLPQVGDRVAAFDAQSVDGAVKNVAFSGKNATVLLFFLSSCPTCHRMMPEWNRAFQRKPSKLEVIGVLMDQEPPGFFLTNPVAFPVVRSPGRDFLRSLKISRAPVMLRVATGGKVEDVAVGMADPIRVGQIFRP